MSNQSYRIAVAGLGTVGLGLLDLLASKADLIAQRAGRPLEVIGINARSRAKDRGLDLSPYPWIDDALDMPGLAGIDGVVELVGGDSGTALSLARKTLGAGKDLITANKALLALHGAELAALAEDTGAAIAYEAAVAGAVPAIKTVREALAGNRIRKIGGILNGTCNYILSTMESTGATYAEVLREAQALGYAEADPTMDVGGVDAAHKLTLLASLGFDQTPDFSACKVKGIEGVSARALAYADRLGYRLRLIGLAEAGGAEVAPMAVPKAGALGAVTGPHNAMQILCDQAGEIFLRGPGAGRKETASAVAADLIDLAHGQRRTPFGTGTRAASASARPAEICQLVILQLGDRAGVMAALTQALATQGVSVDQIMQPGGRDGAADVALITHPAAPVALATAWAYVGAQDYALAPVEAYPIERFGT